MIMIFMILLCGLSDTIQAHYMPTRENVVLLGTIKFGCHLENVSWYISYKGQECEAHVEPHEDNKNAHFELYDTQYPRVLYILITEKPAQPEDTDIQHFKTSKNYTYRLFKLIPMKKNLKKSSLLTTMTQEQEAERYHWDIEELDNKNPSIEIPDETMILFMDPNIIEDLENSDFIKASNIIKLPVIKIKKEIHAHQIKEIANKMSLTIPDFRCFNKKTDLALLPYTNNRVLSMPFNNLKNRI